MNLQPLASLCSRALHAGLDLVFPRVCVVCGRRLNGVERHLCLRCELDMPFADCHTQPFSTIHQRIATHPPVERAAALFDYIRDDPYIHLIHHAKYDGRPEIIRYYAEAFARRLLATTRFFDGIDAVQPVPMHWLKQLRRGYNQTDWLARGIAAPTGLDIVDCLRVVRSHSSQTRKNRFERWINARRSYAATPDAAALLAGKHLLIVDDVITTGSTVKACAEALYAAVPGLRISILSLGVTRQH